MAKQNIINAPITIYTDGFDISGGSTRRTIKVTGGNFYFSGSSGSTVTFTATGSYTYYLPSATSTLTGQSSFLTSTRIPIANASGMLTDSPYLTATDITSGKKLNLTGQLSITLPSADSIAYQVDKAGRAVFVDTTSKKAVHSWSDNAHNIGWNSWDNGSSWQVGDSTAPSAIFRVLAGYMTWGTQTSGTGEPTERMRLTSSGYLGLGVTPSLGMFQIQNATEGLSTFYFKNTSGTQTNKPTMYGLYTDEVGVTSYGLYVDVGDYHNSTAAIFALMHSGGIPVLITLGDGKTGFGTNQPYYTVDINGDLRIRSSYKLWFGNGSGVAGVRSLSLSGSDLVCDGVFKASGYKSSSGSTGVTTSGNFFDYYGTQWTYNIENGLVISFGPI